METEYQIYLSTEIQLNSFNCQVCVVLFVCDEWMDEHV